MPGRKIKRYDNCIVRNIALAFISGIIIVVSLALITPEFNLGKLNVDYSIQGTGVLLDFYGNGSVTVLPHLGLSDLNVSLIIGNKSIVVAQVKLFDLNGVKIGVFNFKKEIRIDTNEYQELRVFPDILVHVDIPGYVPVPASLVTPLENGCYNLLYYIAYQLNTTIDLCYYYENPRLVVNNNENTAFEIRLDRYTNDGSLLTERVIIEPRGQRVIDYHEPSRILVREEQLDFILFKVNVRDGEKILSITSIVHYVFIAIFIAILILTIHKCRKPRR